MRLFSIIGGLAVFLIFNLEAQAQTSSYSLKKGQVLDILFLNPKADAGPVHKRYFKTAIPLATQEGYQFLPGFKIPETPFQGNFHPLKMVMGSWPSLPARKQALHKLETEIPDFHAMRREIWANFDLAYYPLKQDLNFEVDRGKYNVVTEFWRKGKKGMKGYTRQLLANIQSAGGTLILQLKNGASPVGYTHAPDLFILTQWDSKEAFEAFERSNANLDASPLQQVNQFHVQ